VFGELRKAADRLLGSSSRSCPSARVPGFSDRKGRGHRLHRYAKAGWRAGKHSSALQATGMAAVATGTCSCPLLAMHTALSVNDLHSSYKRLQWPDCEVSN
jgi:hypothetical protein